MYTIQSLLENKTSAFGDEYYIFEKKDGQYKGKTYREFVEDTYKLASYLQNQGLIGKKIALVCNLKPAKLCGVDSFGMILASGEEDVKVVFIDDSVKCGERIR